MRSTSLFRVAGVLGVAAVLGVASCAHSENDPEAFCQGWVESTCQALTSCCQSGAKLDPNECRLQLSSKCQASTQTIQVEAGEVQFDGDAASACLGTVSSCADAASLMAKPTTYAVQQACANMVTGFQPVGASCTGAGQCEKAGDFSTCYGGGGTAPGVCAQVVLDQTTCSFSFSTLELHVCPDNLFCARPQAAPSAAEPPSQGEFEFTAPCTPPLAAGAPCSTVSQGVPCATGLYCMPDDATGFGDTGTCTALGTEGAACEPPSFGCAAGLLCQPSPDSEGWTCQTAGPQGGSFCYSTANTTCGNGICEPPENPATCPIDCP